MTVDRRLVVWLALGVVYVVWGSTYLAIRVTVQQAPPLISMGVRYAAAALVLGTVLALRGGPARLRLTARQVLGTAFLGLMLPLLGNGLVALSESHGEPSGVSALLVAIVPLMVVVYRLVERDRPRVSTVVGVVLGFVGLAVLVFAGDSGPAHLPLGPTLLIVFAASCWALGSYLQPRLWLPADPFTTTVYEMAFGGLMLLVLGAFTGEHFTAAYPPQTWLALGYLVVFGSVVAFTAYVWLVANAPISFVSTYAYVNPVVAVFLGWLILGEPVTLAIGLGGGIVVLAVATVIASERPPRRIGHVCADPSVSPGSHADESELGTGARPDTSS